MSAFRNFLLNLPGVAGPKQKVLSFKEKLKWTSIILVAFFILGIIPLFGLGQNALQQFEFLSVILGAEFGSIISLGIGPLVTASIVLQLLVGSGILKIDMTDPEGKRFFQGLQKFTGFIFVIFEAIIYVFMGGLSPDPALKELPIFFQLELLLVFQLCLGGILIMFMDEVISKWGFGSGISLFIAAGVSKSIFIRTFSFLPSPTNPELMTGAIPALFQSLAAGDPQTAALMAATVISTLIIFFVAVYVEAMKVEIPLSFGRIRGHGIRWPLAFLYTSNIPVILVAALLANIQLWARLLQNWGYPLLGTFSGNTPISGLVVWVFPVDVFGAFIRGSLTATDIMHAFVYVLIMVVGAVIFSIFWVQTAGMDPKSQAKNMMASGLQIPGFRRDERVLEYLLKRYIWPLTVMGGIAIGLLAGFADISGALTNGTGLLLTVMVVYRLYEEIAKQHMMDMHPALRQFME